MVFRTSLVALGCMAAAVQGFNLPQTSQVSSRQATALGLGPHRWLSRGKFQRQVVVNQSTYPLGHPGYAAEEKDATHIAPFEEISSKRLRIEAKLRQRSLKRSAAAAAAVENTKGTSDNKKVTSGGGGGATVASSTMNLVKVIVGTGVLALPGGLAAVSDYPVALLPATALLLVLGVFSAYTFQLYGRLTHETQAKSMGELWELTKGKSSSWIVSASTFSFCFGVAVAYSLVIGDFLSKLALSFGGGVPALLGRRQFWILGVTFSTLMPLCNLKSLASLAPMSVLGTAGSILTTLFMAFRCPAIFAGSPYSMAQGAVGKFAAESMKATPALAPQFNTFSQLLSPASLIIAAMATTAYLGHFNAVDFYHGFLKSKSTTTATTTQDEEPLVASSSSIVIDDTELVERKTALHKFGIITGIGFGIVTLLNVLIMSFGYLTFGGNSAGVVLNNYATLDRGAVVSRLLMTLSVIGGYPFMLRACKKSFVQLYNDHKGQVGEKPKLEKWVGRVLITIATSISLLINDAGLVISLNGALMGSAIIYIFPALMFLSHTGKQIKEAGGNISKRLRLERFASRFLVTFGAVSGLMGAGVSIVNACAPHLLR